MGRLDYFSDMTGKMNPMEVAQNNIEQIINELNRNADQLDSLNKSLAIVDKGSLVVPLSGTTYNGSTTLRTGQANSFMAFLQRSDEPNNFYLMPYFLTTGFPSPVNQMSVLAKLASVAGQVTLTIDGGISSGYASPPASITAWYFVFNQPANPPAGT